MCLECRRCSPAPELLPPRRTNIPASHLHHPRRPDLPWSCKGALQGSASCERHLRPCSEAHRLLRWARGCCRNADRVDRPRQDVEYSNNCLQALQARSRGRAQHDALPWMLLIPHKKGSSRCSPQEHEALQILPSSTAKQSPTVRLTDLLRCRGGELSSISAADLQLFHTGPFNTQVVPDTDTEKGSEHVVVLLGHLFLKFVRQGFRGYQVCWVFRNSSFLCPGFLFFPIDHIF